MSSHDDHLGLAFRADEECCPAGWRYGRQDLEVVALPIPGEHEALARLENSRQIDRMSLGGSLCYGRAVQRLIGPDLHGLQLAHRDREDEPD